MKDFEIKDNVLIKYHGNDTEVVIPEGVTAIENLAFQFQKHIRSVVIPESVTSIGDSAFYFCSSLTDISIPEHADIGERAFVGTPWFDQKQQQNPLVIVNHILLDGTACQGKVVLPDDVTKIESFAFYECAEITELVIPKSVTQIGCSICVTCPKLKKITCHDVKFTMEELYHYNAEIIEADRQGREAEWYYQVIEDMITGVLQFILSHDFTVLDAEHYFYGYLEEYTRNSLICRIFRANPHDEKVLTYFRENFDTILHSIIKENRIKTMQSILESGHFIDIDNIDDAIQYAIDKRSYSIQVMLMDYKHQHFDAEEPEVIIRKKFEL